MDVFAARADRCHRFYCVLIVQSDRLTKHEPAAATRDYVYGKENFRFFHVPLHHEVEAHTKKKEREKNPHLGRSTKGFGVAFGRKTSHEY